MAASPLQPNSSGAPAPRPRLLKSGPAPTTKLRLKGANGQAITPKPAGPALKTAAPAPQPAAAQPSAEEEAALKAAAEEAAALKAAEEEAARQAQEEYERQMEEYNRQMEEYNRQLEEHNRQLAAQAEEEARKAAEEEEARKAEEARLAAEAARKAAEEEAARKAAEEEARKAEAAALAEVAAAQAALEAARAKAAALGGAPAPVTVPTPAPAPEPVAAPAPAASSTRPKLTVKPAGAKASGIALKPTTAAGTPRPAAAKPAATPAGSVAQPAEPGPQPAAPKPAGLKPAGIALKPATAAGSSRPALGKPAAAKPGTVEKAEAAPAAEPAPASRPAAIKPSGLAKAAGKPSLGKGLTLPKAVKPAPAAKAAPAPAEQAAPADPAVIAEDVDPADLSEEELAAREAYLAQLQAQAEKPKFWQHPQFKTIAIGFGVILAGLGVWAYINSARNDAMQEHGKYINKYLTIAQELNKKQVESLADVKEKGVTFDCPKAAAEDLLLLVVNPDMKGPGGMSYGPPGKTEGVAQNACLVLAIAAEKDAEIDKLIFTTLGEKCNVMRPSLFRWLVQRMTISNNKGIKGKLKKLAKAVAAKPKWNKKGEMLAAVWECIGLRATAKDLDEITALLGDDAIDGKLATSLSICINNILDMEDDLAEKKRIGDEVFDKLPEKYRGSVIDSLAKSCSPKALAFYKGEMAAPDIWEKSGKQRLSKAMQFFSFYGEDSILDYLLELKEQAGDDEKKLRMVETAIQGVVAQNRERSDAEAQKMLDLVFDKLNEDTSAWNDIINKTDPDAADFVGEGSSEYAKLMEQKKAIEACRRQKQQLLNTLAGLRDYAWVTHILEKYAKDADTDISIQATHALDKVKKNTADYAATKAKFNARDKE